jgi:hypothetical protein
MKSVKKLVSIWNSFLRDLPKMLKFQLFWSLYRDLYLLQVLVQVAENIFRARSELSKLLNTHGAGFYLPFAHRTELVFDGEY